MKDGLQLFDDKWLSLVATLRMVTPWEELRGVNLHNLSNLRKVTFER